MSAQSSPATVERADILSAISEHADTHAKHPTHVPPTGEGASPLPGELEKADILTPPPMNLKRADIQPSRRPALRFRQGYALPGPRPRPPRRRWGGRSAEPAGLDAVLAHLVPDDPLRRPQEPRRLGAVAARALQGIENQILLVLPDRVRERRLHRGPRRLRRLQRGRQVVPVHDLAVAGQNGALDGVLQLADVPGPVIAHQHVDGGRGDALDALVVLP